MAVDDKERLQTNDLDAAKYDQVSGPSHASSSSAVLESQNGVKIH